jgi:hypothetical protein
MQILLFAFNDCNITIMQSFMQSSYARPLKCKKVMPQVLLNIPIKATKL